MSLIESNKTSDGTDARISKSGKPEDHTLGHGFLTIIKNEGKENEEVICIGQHNLLTTMGINYFHQQCYAAPSATALAATDVIALSADTATVLVGDNDLTDEITISGLDRKEATTHSKAATNITSLAYTFTATGTVTAVIKSGLFNSETVSGSTVSHIAKWTTGAVTLVSGDTLAVTWTLTLG